MINSVRLINSPAFNGRVVFDNKSLQRTPELAQEFTLTGDQMKEFAGILKYLKEGGAELAEKLPSDDEFIVSLKKEPDKLELCDCLSLNIDYIPGKESKETLKNISLLRNEDGTISPGPNQFIMDRKMTKRVGYWLDLSRFKESFEANIESILNLAKMAEKSGLKFDKSRMYE